MDASMEPAVYYDPYNVDIVASPYPVYRRLREEAPLYYNEQYNFYAVSRFDEVQRGLSDHQTFISGRGAILEFIQAKVDGEITATVRWILRRCIISIAACCQKYSRPKKWTRSNR